MSADQICANIILVSASRIERLSADTRKQYLENIGVINSKGLRVRKKIEKEKNKLGAHGLILLRKFYTQASDQ